MSTCYVIIMQTIKVNSTSKDSICTSCSIPWLYSISWGPHEQTHICLMMSWLSNKGLTRNLWLLFWVQILFVDGYDSSSRDTCAYGHSMKWTLRDNHTWQSFCLFYFIWKVAWFWKHEVQCKHYNIYVGLAPLWRAKSWSNQKWQTIHKWIWNLQRLKKPKIGFKWINCK